MTLGRFRTLGHSGLVVSPMALGAMTFGRERWGTDSDVSRAVFDAYIDAGGNFIDTAETYSEGRSEELVGRFVAERKLRDDVVIATKFGWRAGSSPISGGNGAKNIARAVEGSLRRLGTDYIDLYWLHVWDTVTPAAEVLDALARLVAAGKILHFGLSNVPAWYVAEMAMLAQQHGRPGPIALQLGYSLTTREIEQEHVPAARRFGLGVVPWSPLDGGFLTGKYGRDQVAATEGRLNGPNPLGDSKFTDRNWGILDSLRAVAEEAGVSMAQTALAWVAARPAVGSVLIGASSIDQLHQNLEALDVRLSPEQLARLDRASAPPPAYPYFIFGDVISQRVFGTEVAGWK
ncbi:aldo/keto reductase [Rhizorhabdus dicambivorans]|uniref:Aldo/keto reductase n=1 Tax=Rhizorhabdus dicambivorans TaxID=1850238 RepID=A0A2A4FZ35_9SPHN|nr:aldo/keto reductase [Rhizorhabdus dicambivorans]ATE65868.1 aldo/keto reductase [Rhizorhabdus dicambivorans]PCE42982.1 aldo/keto reductase [Rhizorhabdus dicambivorans]